MTQTFGLGIFEPLTEKTLDTIESFFRERGSPVCHEVSPFAGASALALLCEQNYRPFEISHVLYRPIKDALAPIAVQDRIRVRVISTEEAALWSEVNARGWAHDHPEFQSVLLELGIILAGREQTLCFLAELDGQPGAAGVLCIHEGVALLGGAATVPEMRRRGLQSALLDHRLHCARERGCDVAMIVAEPGSNSQRNAQRTGFQIAYTRTKWRLHDSAGGTMP